MLKVCEQVCPDRYRPLKMSVYQETPSPTESEGTSRKSYTKLVEETRSYTAFSLAVDDEA
ncbi:hypothetical protein FQN60_005298 [Etheostoma spectabile]|uniref:Uncharacterized protein n=1 Tax=Etheostoma spectabile TaxID=54343 RepID=A0A5J5CAE5_9PERO|nr:hypothetical protein FQN60_005298 [Etheostoma spectabile]